MKKNLLKTLFAGAFLTVLTPLTASADVEINETNFPDENFRNYLLSQSYGQDGVITNEEIKGITSIYVSKYNISSLQGIEYFTALTWLECSSNQLTSLDVSKNTALTGLVCDVNQLTSLDVSQNTALTQLWCQSNQLTSLDVSKNTALIQLFCYSNQLTSLDVSGCTALTELRCYSNQLTSLNVSGCTALKTLYCYNNQLTSLDVSHNTALTSLSCGLNQQTSLDVSQNTALTSLYCYNNQLTFLDVSQNTELTELNCSGNQIKGIAMDMFIASLPVKTSEEYRLYIYYFNEGNVCTRSQVAAIKAKGWIPYDAARFTEYEGCDEPTTETISIGTNDIATYCSPFDLNFANVEGVKAYIASGYDHGTGTVLLTRVTEVPAGTGIVVMGNEGTYDVAIAATQYCYVNMLKGTLTAQSVPTTEGGYTNYILMNGKFYMSSGNGNIAAFKAYLQVPTASSAAGARNVLDYVIDDNTTTGINQTETAQPHDGAVYNLNGQRVEQPRNGLYIKNGHKVMIK